MSELPPKAERIELQAYRLRTRKAGRVHCNRLVHGHLCPPVTAVQLWETPHWCSQVGDQTPLGAERCLLTFKLESRECCCATNKPLETALFLDSSIMLNPSAQNPDCMLTRPLRAKGFWFLVFSKRSEAEALPLHPCAGLRGAQSMSDCMQEIMEHILSSLNCMRSKKGHQAAKSLDTPKNP